MVKAAEQAAASGSPAKAAKPANESQPAPEPVLVNQAFARKYFPNQNPVGLHMGNAQRDEPATGPQPGYLIVGIAGDTKYSRLRRDIMPTMFLPQVGNSAHFELRTAGDPTALVKQVRAIVSQADNNLPLFDVRTQSQQIEQALYQERLMSRLSSFLRVPGPDTGVHRLVWIALIRSGAAHPRAGYSHGPWCAKTRTDAAGGAARTSAGACRRSHWHRARPWRSHGSWPPCFIMCALTILPRLRGLCILLVLVALAACSIPARRAMRIDPMVALRDE